MLAKAEKAIGLAWYDNSSQDARSRVATTVDRYSRPRANLASKPPTTKRSMKPASLTNQRTSGPCALLPAVIETLPGGIIIVKRPQTTLRTQVHGVEDVYLRMTTIFQSHER